jgi:SulP family sulfate permease
VTVLDVYGHLFYAGARTLARLLPKPGDAKNLAVILRLRGRTTVGATLIDELSDYVSQLAEVNGRLYLTGLSEDVHDQMVRTGKLREADPVRAYKATPIVGESTREAIAAARTWLVSTGSETATKEGVPDEDSRDAAASAREAR